MLQLQEKSLSLPRYFLRLDGPSNMKGLSSAGPLDLVDRVMPKRRMSAASAAAAPRARSSAARAVTAAMASCMLAMVAMARSRMLRGPRGLDEVRLAPSGSGSLQVLLVLGFGRPRPPIGRERAAMSEFCTWGSSPKLTGTTTGSPLLLLSKLRSVWESLPSISAGLLLLRVTVTGELRLRVLLLSLPAVL